MIVVATINEQDNTQRKRISILLEFKEILSDGSNEYVSGLSPYPATEKECVKKIYEIWGDWKTFEWISDSGLNWELISTTYLEWSAETGLTCKLIPTPN